MIKRTLLQVDKLTREWIKNAGDEIAAREGCRFDGERGQFVVDWCRRYLKLYEGEFAGQPFEARDWQYDWFMRLFGWTRRDDEWSAILGKETWVRRFRQSTVFIAKKNKKSPTLAAVGLYLTCGDGEEGGKSFFFAKDGKQAREIAGKHSVEMLMASDELMAECKIDATRMQITHMPTRSILVPQSSGDDRTQKAQEGLNGNILVDELHVVDRRLMDRVSRAGISRMEPLLIEVSTAGNDPDSYGHERHLYIQAMDKGEVVNQQMLGVDYSAPQDLNDRDLFADPCKWGRMANPAWGHTIREAEFVQDFEDSRRKGATELALFKQYRLNIWSKSANPLLCGEGWAKGRRRYAMEHLRGRGGGLGIDLSKNEDMSAAVFVCPGESEGTVEIWPMLWMTRDYAERNNHLAGFLNWADQGFIKLVDGLAIQDSDILPLLVEAVKTICPGIVVYDKTYARAMVERLLVDVDDSDLEAADFPQTFDAYANPTVEVRNLVREGQLLHPDNGVVNWQAGHVTAYERAGKLKPVKDDKQRHRKIDAIQALIMGWHGLQVKPVAEKSVYEERGMVWF